ncbi:MAG: 50S ribosomal protein L25/general stress protein Ctc [Mariprofundaceae bacterium]|nr:50S ribosomal protein L25/general stress protein Ctc [Mariprofundaceae bacterium]
MSDFVLEAELREKTGRGEARRLRRDGKLLAVIYGGDKPELAITLNAMDTAKLLNQEAFYTSIVEVKVKGSRGSNKGLVKDVQWHPVRDQAMHIDFHRVSSSDVVQIEVPINPINFEKCPGIVKGGIMETIRHALEVTCRADSIPEAIDVDCAALDVGDSVHVEDLPLPDGVEAQHDVNFTILAIAAPKVEEVASEDEAEAETAEDAAEAGDNASEES